MTQEVDELFGKGGGTATPRVALASTLLVAGLVLAALGLGCSSVPGGIVVLLGWFVVEQDQDRLESGFLPSDARFTMRALRAVSGAAVVLVIGLVLVQFWLLTRTPLYDMMWSSLLDLAGAMRSHAPDPAAVPPVAPIPVPAP